MSIDSKFSWAVLMGKISEKARPLFRPRKGDRSPYFLERVKHDCPAGFQVRITDLRGQAVFNLEDGKAVLAYANRAPEGYGCSWWSTAEHLPQWVLNEVEREFQKEN